jgi:nitroimidazol reductase NimA-like FMN-containing flavoprotein (pyridoxamine 5'-phosphate oxidase superfamily)
MEQVRELFESQMFGVLATEGKAIPHTSLVAFANTGDLSRLVFATTRASRKFLNIRENPNVALLIDDRANSISDFKDAVAVTAHGRAREPQGEEREELLLLYMNKQAPLGNFAGSPSIALMVIDVNVYDIVTRFQRVLELKMNV